MEVLVEDKFTNPADLNLTWECVEFTEEMIVLQIYFDNPLLISSSAYGPATLVLTFYGVEFFKDINGNRLKEAIEIRRVLPLQVDYNTGVTVDKGSKVVSKTT